MRLQYIFWIMALVGIINANIWGAQKNRFAALMWLGFSLFFLFLSVVAMFIEIFVGVQI